MSTEPEYLTIAEVAKRLGVSRTWARHLVDEANISQRLDGVRARLVHRIDLERLVAARSKEKD